MPASSIEACLTEDRRVDLELVVLLLALLALGRRLLSARRLGFGTAPAGVLVDLGHRSAAATSLEQVRVHLLRDGLVLGAHRGARST